MEMHSRRSLYEIHGIDAPPRRQPRRGRIARRVIARLLAVLRKIKAAIEAELAARHAITELASMNDHMLRDLGITWSEIESTVRRARASIGMDYGPSSRTISVRPTLPPRSVLLTLHRKSGLNGNYEGWTHGDCCGAGTEACRLSLRERWSRLGACSKRMSTREESCSISVKRQGWPLSLSSA
jgi:uncharacterized protein YjiS (DUF1127 family)